MFGVFTLNYLVTVGDFWEDWFDELGLYVLLLMGLLLIFDLLVKCLVYLI